MVFIDLSGRIRYLSTAKKNVILIFGDIIHTVKFNVRRQNTWQAQRYNTIYYISEKELLSSWWHLIIYIIMCTVNLLENYNKSQVIKKKFNIVK